MSRPGESVLLLESCPLPCTCSSTHQLIVFRGSLGGDGPVQVFVDGSHTWLATVHLGHALGANLGQRGEQSRSLGGDGGGAAETARVPTKVV